MKKDSLKDNRIFPEEMHDKPKKKKSSSRKKKKKEKKHLHFSWNWFVIAALGVLALIYFGSQYQVFNASRINVRVDQKEYQQQAAVVDTIKSLSPQIAEAERDQKIQNLLGNE